MAYTPGSHQGRSRLILDPVSGRRLGLLLFLIAQPLLLLVSDHPDIAEPLLEGTGPGTFTWEHDDECQLDPCLFMVPKGSRIERSEVLISDPTYETTPTDCESECYTPWFWGYRGVGMIDPGMFSQNNITISLGERGEFLIVDDLGPANLSGLSLGAWLLISVIGAVLFVRGAAGPPGRPRTHRGRSGVVSFDSVAIPEEDDGSE